METFTAYDALVVVDLNNFSAVVGGSIEVSLGGGAGTDTSTAAGAFIGNNGYKILHSISLLYLNL